MPIQWPLGLKNIARFTISPCNRNLQFEKTGWLGTYDPAINQDKNTTLVIPIKFTITVPKYSTIKGKNPALPSVEAVLISEWPITSTSEKRQQL